MNRGVRIGRAVREALPGGALLLLGLMASDWAESEAVDRRRPAPVLAGAVHINEPDHALYTRALRDVGLNAVQVTAYARQGEWDSSVLSFDRDSSGLRHELRAARGEGLKAMLVLRTDMEHALARNRHLWHGMIWPTDAELDGWFEHYREFVLWGARIAAEEGVELFAIGNELTSMTSTRFGNTLPEPLAFYLDPERSASFRRSLGVCEEALDAHVREDMLSWPDGKRYEDLSASLVGQEEAWRSWAKTVTGGAGVQPLQQRGRALDARWRDLIAEVRDVYPGAVTYGATFDQVERVGFWDALDAIGTTAYFPLAPYDAMRPPRKSVLERSWSRVAAQLETIAVDTAPAGASPSPVYLLELGWTRRIGATVRPWSYERLELLTDRDGASQCVVWEQQPERHVDRLRALQGLVRVVRRGGMPSLRGFSLWKVTTRPYHWEDESFAVLLPAYDLIVEDADFLDAAGGLAQALEGAEHRAPVR